MLIQVFGGAVLAFFYIKSGFPQFYTPVPMYDRNDFALVLNVALPMGLFWAFSAPSATARKLFWGVVLAFGTCIMMGQSRGGFVTLAVTALFTVVSVKGLQLRYRILPPILIALGLLLLPAEVQERLSTILNPTEDYNFNDEQGRIEIWKRGLGYVADHKLLGVGWDNFPVAEGTLSANAQSFGYARNTAVHNSFLQVAAETGIPGLALWAGMIFVTMWRLFRLRMRLRRKAQSEQWRDYQLCADFLLVSLIGFCIGAQFLTMAYFPIIFGQVALAAGLEVSYATDRRRHSGSSGRSTRMVRAA
jgi:O-antigen ligase